MKRVLIIEDDAITAHIYKTRLEREGFQVEVANDGQAGFFRLHEATPDALLLDLMLPKLNGLDILKKIRAQSRFQALPVLVFTNAYVPNMVMDATRAGATHVFNKASLNPRQLIETLQACLLSAMTAAPGSPVVPGALSLAASPAHPAPDPATKSPRPDAWGGEAPFHSAPPPSPARPSAPSIPPAEPPELGSSGSPSDADPLRQFLAAAPAKLAVLRREHLKFSRVQEEADSLRLPPLLELYTQVHAFTGSAGLVGLKDLSEMAAVLEVLLKSLHDNPKNINVSTLRTVAHALDFLERLLRYDSPTSLLAAPAQILVVDDEILSRRAITFALEKARLKCVSVDRPEVALTLLAETPFELVFTDVQMPGIDGFGLCAKIRALPGHASTPVVFVTSLNDFNSRARSSLSGGNDFIAKPFLFIELTVKALIHLMQRRMQS